MTWYVNHDAYDIRQIKPYAAYDLTNNTWAVEPPDLPEHSAADFHPALLTEARAVAAQLRAILKLDEPQRTRQARSLWQYIHDMRSEAFSGEGEGWSDPGNVIEKYLDQHPHNLLGKLRALLFSSTGSIQDPDEDEGESGTLHPHEFGKLTFSDYPGRDISYVSEALHHREPKYMAELTDHVRQHGVTHPVEIAHHGEGEWEVGQGHHRLVSAWKLGKGIPYVRTPEHGDYWPEDSESHLRDSDHWRNTRRQQFPEEYKAYMRRGEHDDPFRGKWAARRKNKGQVNYRPAEGEKRCGSCVMFRPAPGDSEPGSCTLVKGGIMFDYTCDEWYAKGKTASFRDEDLPPAQRAVFQRYDEPEGWRGIRRHFLEVAKNPEPGTHVWRGEHRPAGEDLEHATTGMHWTADPDMAIKGYAWPGKKVVLWQGQVDHPDQHFPRDHPIWYGQHRSLDSEAEVRFRPGAQVKLHGAYVWHHPGGDDTEAPGHLRYPREDMKRDPSAPGAVKPDPGWEWHPMDRTITIRHSGRGAADYEHLGIPREAAAQRPERLFHASAEMLEPGTELTAPHPGGRIYMSGDLGTAREWAETIGRHHIHEVEPHGHLGNMTHPAGLRQYMAPGATVIRHVETTQPFAPSTAAVRTVPSRDGADGISKSMMVAIVPPAEVLDHLRDIMKPLRHETEARSKMHITLLYLGEEDDHPERQLGKLEDLVRQWAKTQRPFEATTQGSGTFANKGNHALHALVDIPGGHEIHGSLLDFLKGHGISAIPAKHGFLPHITLAYSKQPVRFLPQVKKMKWPVGEIWYCRGGRWESIPLGRN
jgi:2'-5' RNA ligase